MNPVRILVIEDDALVRATIRLMLERAGHAVAEARHGQEGLASIRAGAPDLVICDIVMPGMEGIETIREIRRAHAALPVIAISGFEFRNRSLRSGDILHMAELLGATCSIRKPVHASELLEAVDRCLAGDEASHPAARGSA